MSESNSKNIAKGESFKWAFERMPESFAAGYFLETVAIAESIVTDRLISFMVGQGSSYKVDKTQLGMLLRDMTEKGHKWDDGTDRLVDSLKKWWNLRNTAIHQAVKSEPGTPTKPVAEFQAVAKEAAAEGIRLAKETVAWHRKMKAKSL